MTDSLYIMTPTMFENLKSVCGFTNMNGETYMAHICIIFDKRLTDDQKKIIMKETNIGETLKYLKTIVNYTHEY